MELTFGQYKGIAISSLPEDYLTWGADNLSSGKWKKAFSEELERRDKLENWCLENCLSDSDKLLEVLEQMHLAQLKNDPCLQYEDVDIYSESTSMAEFDLKQYQARKKYDAAVEKVSAEFSRYLESYNISPENIAVLIRICQRGNSVDVTDPEYRHIAKDYADHLKVLTKAEKQDFCLDLALRVSPKNYRGCFAFKLKYDCVPSPEILY